MNFIESNSICLSEHKKDSAFLLFLIIGVIDKGLTQLTNILADYMMVFAVPVLAHYPDFTSHEDVAQLQMIRQCLWFILEPLIIKNDLYCFGFYKNLIEKMKNHKDALKGDDDAVNYVSIFKCKTKGFFANFTYSN